jgi:hypothetical protein
MPDTRWPRRARAAPRRSPPPIEIRRNSFGSTRLAKGMEEPPGLSPVTLEGELSYLIKTGLQRGGATRRRYKCLPYICNHRRHRYILIALSGLNARKCCIATTGLITHSLYFAELEHGEFLTDAKSETDVCKKSTGPTRIHTTWDTLAVPRSNIEYFSLLPKLRSLIVICSNSFDI